LSNFRRLLECVCECICVPLSLKRKMCTTAMYAKHSPASHVHLHYNLGYLYTTMLHILAQSCPSEVFSAELLCDVLSILNAHVQICATIRNTTLKNPSFTFHKVISQLEILIRTAKCATYRKRDQRILINLYIIIFGALYTCHHHQYLNLPQGLLVDQKNNEWN